MQILDPMMDSDAPIDGTRDLARFGYQPQQYQWHPPQRLIPFQALPLADDDGVRRGLNGDWAHYPIVQPAARELRSENRIKFDNPRQTAGEAFQGGDREIQNCRDFSVFIECIPINSQSALSFGCLPRRSRIMVRMIFGSSSIALNTGAARVDFSVVGARTSPSFVPVRFFRSVGAFLL
jgi:hypothetical protein